MWIVNHRKIFYGISGVLILASLLAISVWGLRPSIDFAGGSLLDVAFDGGSPSAEEVNRVVGELGLRGASVRPSDDGFILRLPEIDQSQKETILAELSFGGAYTPTEKTFSNVGPILGKEAVAKSWISIVLVLLLIVLFIAFAFRKVSKPVSSWIYGLVAITALFHDVLIPTGIFAALGYFYGIEVDTLFVTALLVILGFSVHDTIVVFDRVRENLKKNQESKDEKPFEEIVGVSINETLIRSLNTSLTTLLAIFILYIFGPESVKNFTLALLIGIFIGTYSSIFIGSPLLVTISQFRNAKR